MTEAGARFLLVWVLACSAGVLLAIPRAVWPQLPALRLSRVDTRQAREQDERLAAQAEQYAGFEALQTLYEQSNQLEAGSRVSSAEVQRLDREMASALRAIVQEQGQDALTALRAHAAVSAIEELQGKRSPAVLGGLVALLKQYGAVAYGKTIIPELALRAVVKVRWNLVHRLALTHGLSEPEQEAYWGWLALHAIMKDASVRQRALREYAKFAENDQGLQGAIAWVLGEQDQAARLFRKGFDRDWRLYWRNYAHGAAVARVDTSRHIP